MSKYTTNNPYNPYNLEATAPRAVIFPVKAIAKGPTFQQEVFRLKVQPWTKFV